MSARASAINLNGVFWHAPKCRKSATSLLPATMIPASAVPRQTAATTLALDESAVISRERGKFDRAKRA